MLKKIRGKQESKKKERKKGKKEGRRKRKEGRKGEGGRKKKENVKIRFIPEMIYWLHQLHNLPSLYPSVVFTNHLHIFLFLLYLETRLFC